MTRRRSRILLLLAGFALALAVGAIMARHFEERRRWTRNVRHDATWLFSTLEAGHSRPLEHHAATLNSQRQNELALGLVAHMDTLLATDFSSLTPEFEVSGESATALFRCADGVHVLFTSRNDGDMWDLTRIHQ